MKFSIVAVPCLSKYNSIIKNAIGNAAEIEEVVDCSTYLTNFIEKFQETHMQNYRLIKMCMKVKSRVQFFLWKDY